jgi:hypothetical protein
VSVSRRKERESVNKTELIEEIARKTDSAKGEAQMYLESFEKVVAEALPNHGLWEVLRPRTEGPGRRQPSDQREDAYPWLESASVQCGQGAQGNRLEAAGSREVDWREIRARS